MTPSVVLIRAFPFPHSVVRPSWSIAFVFTLRFVPFFPSPESPAFLFYFFASFIPLVHSISLLASLAQLHPFAHSAQSIFLAHPPRWHLFFLLPGSVLALSRFLFSLSLSPNPSSSSSPPTSPHRHQRLRENHHHRLIDCPWRVPPCLGLAALRKVKKKHPNEKEFDQRKQAVLSAAH